MKGSGIKDAVALRAEGAFAHAYERFQNVVAQECAAGSPNVKDERLSCSTANR